MTPQNRKQNAQKSLARQLSCLPPREDNSPAWFHPPAEIPASVPICLAARWGGRWGGTQAQQALPLDRRAPVKNVCSTFRFSRRRRGRHGTESSNHHWRRLRYVLCPRPRFETTADALDKALVSPLRRTSHRRDGGSLLST